jgi:peptidoglycan/LPS O-acetylase OafA/YrhL
VTNNAPIPPSSGPVPLAEVKQSFRFPELDGLRGLAALCVAVFHHMSGPAEKFPILHRVLLLSELTPVSRDTFFILSGFLIGGILLRMRNLPEYYKPFYTRRFLRIMPCITPGSHSFALCITSHPDGAWLSPRAIAPPSSLHRQLS